MVYLIINGFRHTEGQVFEITDTNGQTNNSTTTHNLTGIPPGSLLVLATHSAQCANLNATIGSSPSLTWTKQVDSVGGCGNAEIWTAVYSAGGNIDITSSWGSAYQSSMIYVITGANTDIDGAFAVGTSQDSADINITTESDDSIIICTTVDWNGATGTRTYIGTPIELMYNPVAEGTSYHYYYTTGTAGLHNVGFTSPSEIGSMNSAVLEIKLGVPLIPDTEDPTAPTLSLGTVTHNSISLSWTGATDNVGVTEYEVYKDGVLLTTVASSPYTATGLSPETEYDFTVRAKDAAGNTSVDSNTVTDTTEAAPSGEGEPFSFTEIAYSEPDIINPGRGAEQWHNSSQRISNPSTDLNDVEDENSYDVYYRKQWTWFEDTTEGNYTFGGFDGLIEGAIDNGQRLSFGIMPVYTGSSIGENETYDGAGSSYPEYVHDYMQAEVSSSNRDFIRNGWWVPNWNHTKYLERLRALHTALYAHIMSSSYTPSSGPNAGQNIPYKDAIYCIDIRGYGQWGEWHTYDIADDGSGNSSAAPHPGNTYPTTATFKEIIDLHTEEFPNWPLVVMIAAYNGTGGSGFPILHHNNEVGLYALQATNTWGKVGWRRDQVGSEEEYLDDILDGNTSTFGGSATFGSLFLDICKTAPGTGEPYPNAAAAWGMANVATKVALYGHTSFGNGNYPTQINDSTSANNTRLGFKRCGYRLKITDGLVPTTITRDVPFNISTNWINVGVAPTYDEWDVVFELHNGGGSVVWSGTSDKVLKLFTPDEGEVETVDTFTVPSGVSAGTYDLCVRVKPSNGVKTRPNMALAIQGINAGNSYHNKFYKIYDGVIVS